MYMRAFCVCVCMCGFCLCIFPLSLYDCVLCAHAPVHSAAIKVAIARKQYGIKYPKMYEGTENSVFDCVQRAHQNTLEYLPSFLALLMLNGLAAPLSTAAVGMVWNVARIVYVIGYGKGDPNGRLPGAAVSGLAFIGLVLATFANGVLQSGILTPA
jgi:glutathione S-transferase